MKHAPEEFNWNLFGVLCLAIFTSMVGSGIVVPILPSYANDLGATSLQIGCIFGAFSLSLSIFTPITGYLSDSLGRKPFILLGLFLYCASSVGYIVFNQVYAIIVIRCVQGGAAGLITAAEAYTGDIAPKGKEGRIMGIMNASLAAGLCTGPLIGGITADTFGIRSSFQIMGMISLISFLICLWRLPSVRSEKSIIHSTIHRHSPNYKAFFQNRRLVGLFLFRFVSTMCIGTIWAFAPLIADTEYHMTGTAIGMIIMIGVLVSAILMPITGIVADRFGKRLLLIVGGLMMAISMIYFAQIQSGRDFYMASILMGIGNGISLPAIMSIAVSAGRIHNSIGTFVSLVILSETLGMTAGAVISGSIIQSFGMTSTFIGGMVVMVLITAYVGLNITQVKGAGSNPL